MSTVVKQSASAESAHSYSVSSGDSPSGSPFFFPPVYGIFALVLVTVAFFAGHRSGQLNLAFPLLSGLLAVWLFTVDRRLYLQFVLALWFVVPCLRRLVDFTSTWTDPSPILLAPYLVTLVAPALLLSRLATASLKQLLPFAAAFAGVLIGACFGLFINPFHSLVMGLLNWGCPVLFGAALFIDQQHRADYHQALCKALPLWLAVTSGYTLLQFAFVFPWDALWIISLDSPSMRSTDPFTIRAFGNLNSPGTAAFVLAAGALWILNSRVRFRLALFALSLCALFTTQIRASWLAFAFGLALSLFWRTRRTLPAVLPIVAVIFLAAVLGSFQNNGLAPLTERMQTLQQASDDNSANSRLDGYRAAWDEVLRRPLGHGLGVAEDVFDISGSFSLRDSGLVDGFISLGVVGALLYATGLTLLLWSTLQSSPSAQALQIIPVLALLAALPLGSTTVAFLGVLLWMFLSLGVNDRLKPTEAAHSQS